MIWVQRPSSANDDDDDGQWTLSLPLFSPAADSCVCLLQRRGIPGGK